MARNDDFRVIASLNIAQSEAQINADLKEISKKLADKGVPKFKAFMSISTKQMEEDLKRLPEKVKQLTSDQITAIDLGKQSTLSGLEAWWNKNNRAAKNSDFVSEFNRLKSSLSDVNRMDLANIRREVALFKNNIRAAGLEGQNFRDTIKNAISKFSDWGIASTIVMQVVHRLNDVVINVKDINSAVVELRKVTDATDSQFSQFLDRAKSKAVDLGATITDLIAATSNFSRLGFSLEDSEDLGQAATIYANVGDDISSIDDATDSIISSMKAFNIEAKNSISIIDRLNEVGNTTSISSGDLGEALKRSASAMAEANNTIDETIALIVAGNEVVRDADSVGTGLKTASLRIRGATADLKEMGEEVDELVSSTPKLRKSLQALTGVDIMNGDKFKSTYQILKEISKVLPSLSDPSRAAVLEMLFGKRQANIGASILKNFDSAEKALQSSLNSTGSAMKEYDTWLNSIEAKQQRFDAQFQSFSEAILSSELVKGTYDAGTGVLGFFTKLIDTLGPIPTLAVTAATALSVFKNVGRPEALGRKYAHHNLTVTLSESYANMVIYDKGLCKKRLKWCA